MAYPKDDAKLKKWEEGIAAAYKKDPGSWDAYDKTIQTTIADYTANLSTVTGFAAPDWKVVKAMIWTETGATSDQWDTAPMQIGVNKDPGLHELLTTTQGKLILPTTYRTTLTEKNVPEDGTKNIMAGVGYLLKISAKFGYVYPVTPPTQTITSPSPGPGVTPTPVTPDLPKVGVPPLQKGSTHPDDAHGKHHPKKVHQTKPKMVIGITGWRELTLDFIAKHYNVGDGNYPGKLQYALDVINNPQSVLAPPPAKPPVPGAPGVKK